MTIWTFLSAIWVIGVLVYLDRLRKHPGAESDAREASFVTRIKCSIVAYGLFVAAFLGLSILLAKLTQNTALFYDAPMALVASPAFTLIVFAGSWLAAPAVMNVLPASTFVEPADDEAEDAPAPALHAPPVATTPSEPGVINLDPDALASADANAQARDVR